MLQVANTVVNATGMYSSQAVSATNVVGAEWLKILEVFTGKECRRRVNKKIIETQPLCR